MRARLLSTLILGFGVLGSAALAHDGHAEEAPPVDGPVVQYDGFKAVAVSLRSLDDLARVRAVAEDMLECEPRLTGETRFLISPRRMGDLEALGVPMRIVMDDVQAVIDAERARLAEAPPVGAIGADGAGYYADFRDLSTTSSYLDQIIGLNPTIASRISVGLSLQGRDIFGVRISGPGAVGSKPAVWIQAVQHAREWAVLPVAMWTAEQLVSQYGVNSQVTNLVNSLEIYIVPIVNPDGYVYTWATDRLWRKNRRPNAGGSFGVDLNRNWDFQWGGTGSSGVPTDETYRGTAPFSEPETTVVSQYIAARPNMRTLIDLHSNGQVIIVPWGWSIEPCPDQREFNGFATGISAAVQSVNGVFHNPGPSGVVLYLSAGNVRDWAYGVEGITPTTIEVRAGTSGFTPPPSSIAPTNAEVYAGIVSALTYSATTSPIRFNVPADPPKAISTTASTPIQTQVSVMPGPNATIASVTLFSRFGTSGAFVGTAMSAGANGVYSGSIPAPIPAAAGCALGVAQYYFQATDGSGATATFPAAGASGPLTIPIGVSTAVFSDNFETNQGWTVGAAGDTATAGLWTRADPVTNTAQPEVDNPLGAGTLCFITANGAAGSVLVNDVDNGPTTLTSPVINGVGAGQLWASYSRWFSNDLGANRNQVGDDLRAFVSGDGVNYALVETCTENVYRWVPRSFRVADFTAPTATMRLRFVARDTAPDSCVEAGVDDVSVYRVVCSSLVGDVNGDGLVNFTDLNIVLGAFGQTGLPGRLAGDANADGAVNFADLNIVLGNFGAGT